MTSLADPLGARPERPSPAAQPARERPPSPRPRLAPNLADPAAGRIEGLDGLRAVAVLAVLVFHLRPSAMPGGFLGVDVFFVISGFLITTLLLRERRGTGRVDLPAFWTRRARRLLPALVLVVFVSTSAASVVDRDLLVGIRRQMLGALTFSTNWLDIRAGADYFDDTAPSLFVTFWSLAVEEQFYLLWPLAFVSLVAVTTTATQRVRVALVVAAASALLMAVLFGPTAITRVYYGTDTHAFGLMIGVALAFAFSGPARLLASGRWRHLRRWIGFAALVALAGLFVTVDSEAAITYRGGILVASLLSAAMVASLPGEQSAFTRLFRLPALEWIGKRSYGLYLWHWPVLLIVTAALPATAPGVGLDARTVAIVVGVTVALTEASYRWVETPIRRDGFRNTWESMRTSSRRWDGEPRSNGLTRVLTASAVAVMVVAAVGVTQAPEKSEAQLSVERGEQAIEAQQTPGPARAGDGTEPEAEGSPDAWPPALPVPPGDLMVGLGDSVLSGAAPAMYERFPGIYLDATPIRQWSDAPALVQAMIDAGTMRDVVILQFGTNAGFNQDESVQALREVLDMLGPDRRVVLITIVGVSEWVPETNETLKQISAEYPNTIVADWNAIIRERPDLLHSDRTHPNFEGIQVYADLLASSLEELGPA